MRRFFAAPENFIQNKVRLSLDESRHLRDVLRLREGSEVAVFDGRGREYSCTIEKLNRGSESVELTIKESLAISQNESKLDLTLGLALLKGEKFDLVIQKVTELGVSRIVPLETKRADVRLRDVKEIAKKLERWQRIALEAAKQSGRSIVPEISQPIALQKFLPVSDNEEFRIFFAERGGNASIEDSNERTTKVTVVVGAEGGWKDFEIEAAREQNFKIVTLGSRILRAETAAIVAVTLLQHRFGDLC